MKKRKQSPQQSHTSKVFCFIVMLAFIAGFIWLAIYSQNYQAEKYLSESDIKEIIEAKKQESIQPQPVKLYRPKTEAERNRIIGEVWGIKGNLSETKIFTARK